MTDITKLAQEIVTKHRKLMSLWAAGKTKVAGKEMALIFDAGQLAQAVIDAGIEELEEISQTSCACKFERDMFNGNSKLVESCKYHLDKLKEAKAEQREKDAEIAETIWHDFKNVLHDDITLSNRIAKAIRESKDD